MRDDITTIPVSEVFEPREGCPLCRLRSTLEDRVVEYITGAAMMEPDVRMETNKQGFCIDHYRMMLKKRNRLGVALILESHLDEMEKQIYAGPPIIGKSVKNQAKSAVKAADTCFVCNQVDWAMKRMLATVCRLWETEKEFRALFDEQTALCLPHFSALVEAATRNMSKKTAPDFMKAAATLSRRTLQEIREDVSHFCKMFDYRNSGENADWGNSRDAIERAIWYLTARQP